MLRPGGALVVLSLDAHASREVTATYGERLEFAHPSPQEFLASFERTWTQCRMKAERDTKYVRAWTEDGAIQVARFHSYIDGAATASAYARPATPEDLGCVKVAA